MTFLLKSFVDVLENVLRGKSYTYRVAPTETVSNESLKLWEQRGYEPAKTGIAYMKFAGSDKEYTYPAYFWSH